MNIGKKGIALIQSFEKCVLHVYDDGYGYDTVGWGHLVKPGESFPKNITQQQADDLFAADLQKYVNRVNHLVKVELNQNQFDALVSFDFNTEALHKSTLLKKVNAGNFSSAASQFKNWIYSNGKVSRGLIRRREAERKLFMEPVAGVTVARRESVDTGALADSGTSPLPLQPASNMPGNALETTFTAKTADSSSEGANAAQAVTVVQPATSETANTPVVSEPHDEPVQASQGGIRSLWATVTGNLAAIGTAIWAAVSNNASLIKWALICGGAVGVIYLLRLTILDVVRMWATADPKKYNVR